MKFIIRADGGKKTGMGHIMRSSVLAEALRKYGELSYVCLNGEEYQAGRQYLKENSFDVLSFSEEELLNRLQDIDYDCIIVDDYKVDKTFFEGIKKKNALVGYFDDNKVEEYPVDFIINQNPYAEDLGYDKVRYLKTFLGSQYALLRKEFRNLPPFFAREEIKDLLITVGGSDINKVSERIVIQLLDAIPETMLHVVIGPAFPKGIMEDICSPRLKKYYNPKMSELMLNCDLAVSCDARDGRVVQEFPRLAASARHDARPRLSAVLVLFPATARAAPCERRHGPGFVSAGAARRMGYTAVLLRHHLCRRRAWRNGLPRPCLAISLCGSGCHFGQHSHRHPVGHR